ncbi:MAG: HD domain-containing protein [Deltaproteobacteria bacterium]|nr:HD domain-containing protein [Deltaproteobacteria bacterium]
MKGAIKAIDAEMARHLAVRFAGALSARRLYASTNPALHRTLEHLHADITGVLQTSVVNHISIALLTQGLSIGSVPLLTPPESAEKLIDAMKQRGLEILTVSRGVALSELETMMSLLTIDVAELTAVDVDGWLRVRGAEHVSAKHLEIAEKNVVRSMKEVYSGGRDVLGKEFRRANASGAVELGAMSELASAMIDLVLRSDVPVTTMLALKGREDFAWMHSMNVSLLASSQAASLGLDEVTVRSIGTAGLVHDIGKSTIPESISLKRTPLTPGEKKLVEAHSVEGARILLRTQGGAGLEAIVAAEHHAPWTEDPHLASQLVAIADAFDTIRSLRPFSDRPSLRTALRFMLKHLRHRLNPYLLQRFCLMCGMYQANDIVQFESGETARVIGNSEEMGSRPIIEVIETGSGVAARGTVADLSEAHLRSVQILRDPVYFFDDLDEAAIDAMA